MIIHQVTEAHTGWTDDDLALLQGFLERMYDATVSLRRYPAAPKQNREYQDRKLKACCALAAAMVNASDDAERDGTNPSADLHPNDMQKREEAWRLPHPAGDVKHER